MPTFLFNEIIFGPVKSRRLGVSLGINLLPVTKKMCNYNCIYCECGLTSTNYIFVEDMPLRKEVRSELEKKLLEMKGNNQHLDVITFAGNGEPTLSPDFPQIIDDTIKLRDNIFPEAKIAVLSNATTIKNSKIRNALLKVDQNILKLDSVNDNTVNLINKPNNKFYSTAKKVQNLKKFNGQLIIQTLFLRGISEGQKIDNTSAEELSEWVKAIDEIRPSEVMIYTISRDTPAGSKLEKIPLDELNSIAQMINKLGIKTQVSG